MKVGMTPRDARTPPPDVKSSLRDALRLGGRPMAFVALFSLATNVLFLALPLYTFQVYGRVLSSQSGSTLLVLTLAALFVFAVSGVLDALRSQILIEYGGHFDEKVSGSLFETLFDPNLQRRPGGRAQALRDLDLLRQTLSGNVVPVLFDVPWIPVFLLALFMINPIIGSVATAGGLVLLALAFAQDRVTRGSSNSSNEAALQSYSFTDAAVRNVDVVQAMGMLPSIRALWGAYRTETLDRSSTASSRTAFFTSAIQFARLTVQILIIAVGAYLIIRQAIPAGALFANMILSARALAPIERIVGSYNTLASALQAYQRLKKLDGTPFTSSVATELPRPRGALQVDRVSFARPGSSAMLVANVSFELAPGQTLGVMGPSGAGKSTLTRLLTGVWKPLVGHVRLDGAEVSSWNRESFGRYVGYLPQDVELFSGTVRDNIARFRADSLDEDVVAAGQLAGAHDLILRLPKGYETEVGEGGVTLSAGQRQRVGLARALFGRPAFVVLDEPNAALDVEGEAALMGALAELKALGTTVVIVSHKPTAFRTADRILALRAGRPEMFGPAQEILARLLKPAPSERLEAASR